MRGCWARVRSRPELAGHPRLNVPAGKVIKLQAGGFATRDAATEALHAIGRDPAARAEELAPPEFVALAEALPA